MPAGSMFSSSPSAGLRFPVHPSSPKDLMIPATGGSSATTFGSTATSSSASSTATKVLNPTTTPNDRLGKDAFLKLLVAQLKYQNPLSPVDGTAFVAQTAQLTMTESLDELSKLQQTSVADGNRRSAAELVGRTITYNNGTAVVEGTVTSALMNGGNPVLLLGRTEVPLAAVLEVRSTRASTATPAPTAPALA